MTIVDLSAWQGTISTAVFKQWKAVGVTRIIHKIGGGDDGIYKDGHHDANVTNARAAGLIADRYYFNGGDPKTAAGKIASWLTGAMKLQGDERFFWDVEGGSAWSDSQVHAATVALRSHGVSPFGFYGSSSILGGYPQAEKDGLVLWVASYGSNSGTPEGHPGLGVWSSFWAWQYTSNGSLPGYSGRLDLSTSDGTGTSGGGSATTSGNLTTRSTAAIQKALIGKGFTVGSTGADGIYGPATTAAVKAFQKSVGVTVDGIYGPDTDAYLFPASKPAAKPGVKAPEYPLPSGSYFGPKSGPAQSVSGYYGHAADLKVWQTRMKTRGWILTPDGLYGPQTASVALAFQKEKGLAADSLIGPATWAAAWTAPVTPA